MPQEFQANVFPVLSYRDPDTALEWLAQAFGFEPLQVSRDDSGAVMHAEMRLGQGVIMFGTASEAVVPASVYAYVADPDGHYAHARAAGAEITREIEDTFYDSREYS